MPFAPQRPKTLTVGCHSSTRIRRPAWTHKLSGSARQPASIAVAPLTKPSRVAVSAEKPGGGEAAVVGCAPLRSVFPPAHPAAASVSTRAAVAAMQAAWGDGPMALLYGTAVPRRGRGT